MPWICDCKRRCFPPDGSYCDENMRVTQQECLPLFFKDQNVLNDMFHSKRIVGGRTVCRLTQTCPFNISVRCHVVLVTNLCDVLSVRLVQEKQCPLHVYNQNIDCGLQAGTPLVGVASQFQADANDCTLFMCLFSPQKVTTQSARWQTHKMNSLFQLNGCFN